VEFIIVSTRMKGNLMDDSAQESAGAVQTAQTDIDLDLRALLRLIQRNAGLVALLAISGMLVYGVTAYLGYPSDAPAVLVLFHHPGLLFVWFLALLILLEIVVLRDPPRRKYLARAVVVTVLSALIVVLVYVGATNLLKPIGDLLNFLLGRARGSALTFTVANFLPIAVFVVLTTWRLTRRLRGQSPNPDHPDDLPTVPALLSGDLIAGGIIIAVLMLIFREQTINSAIDLIEQLPAHPTNWPHVAICTLSWPVVPANYTCGVGGGGPNDPPTLTFIDSVLTRICFAAALGILAISATIAALGALQPGQQIAQVLFQAMRTGLYRRYRVVVDLLWLMGRNILWTGLTLIGVAGLGFAARFNRLFLHLASDQSVCGHLTPAATQACLGNDLNDYMCADKWWQLGQCVPQDPTRNAALTLAQASQLEYPLLVLTILAGVVAAAAIAVAIGLLLSNEPLAGAVALFIGRVAYAMLLVLWLYAFFFILVDNLLLLIGVQRSPFPGPGVATLVSGLALAVVFAILALPSILRGRHQAN
jgi:hypothetical protein